MNGNMGQLLGDALLVVFTFFGVVPVLLNTVSQFGVLKRFADEMVREGVISEEKVKALLPKKQIAGVVISALMLFVLFTACIKTAPFGWVCAGVPFLLGLFKYRNIVEFNSFTVQRFQNNFKGEYDKRKMQKYIETHF
ncbi:MAG: hypothetical protein II418_03375 [Firmicutes bacterium]|nr:hypothetical protein [Bacillota bacterium]MBQ2217960.1 hypothetical protein [Bacillota bacterium]